MGEKARKKAAEKKDDSEDGSDDDDEEGSEPDLSWLPDPDKLYGDGDKNSNQDDNEDDNEDDEAEDDSEDEDETETVQVKEGKRALTVIKSVIPAKRSRQDSSSEEDDDEDDDNVLDTGLSLGEDEDLALKLLSK